MTIYELFCSRPGENGIRIQRFERLFLLSRDLRALFDGIQIGLQFLDVLLLGWAWVLTGGSSAGCCGSFCRSLASATGALSLRRKCEHRDR